MNSIAYDMDVYCVELSKAQSYFDSLEKQEKEVDFKFVKRLISNIELKRKELKNKYSSETLNNNSEKINLITKQINKSLDNVVKQTEAEKYSVGLELEKINNKKKIATYIR
jgi:hypothetical protein